MGVKFSHKRKVEITSKNGFERTTVSHDCYNENKESQCAVISDLQQSSSSCRTNLAEVESQCSTQRVRIIHCQKPLNDHLEGMNNSTEEQSVEERKMSPVARNQSIQETVHDRFEFREDPSSSVDEDGVVEQCWEKIYESCEHSDLKKQQYKDVDKSYKGWKVVRLFVSSTFNDFYAEREFIVKKIVPDLKAWCESRKLHFIECDLRWGIPKDTTTEDTVNICLNELDRCKEETGGQPFFLGLLGERYGWIPDTNQLSLSTIERYKWIQSLSITHMEIVHGVIRTQSQNAAFLIRDPSIADELPSRFVSDFQNESTLCVEHTKRLKSELKKHYPSQVFNYKCKYDGTDKSSGVEKVVLKELEDEFASAIVNFFKSAISNYYLELDDSKETQDEVSRRAQDAFIEIRGQLVIGRDLEIQEAVTFVDKHLQESHNARLGSERTNPSVLLVVGGSGMGKSALLARVVSVIRENNKRCCVYNFASAGVNSTDVTQVLGKLIKWLRQLTGIKEEETGFSDFRIMLTEFHKLLVLFGEISPTRQLVIILDAVNQLEGHQGALLDWLPLPLPDKVCLIISSTEGTHAKYLREKFQGSIKERAIGTFDHNAAKQLVEVYLERYNKKLDDGQLTKLTSSPGAVNPLWLSLACEELRIYGVFETVTEKIESLPDTIDDLLGLIIKRLVDEDETGLVKDVLILLHSSPNGLTETDLLTTIGGDSPPAMILWTQCKRLLKFLLINTGNKADEEMLSFFHSSVSRAVTRLFLTDNKDIERKYRLRLADYFENQCSDKRRTAEELPVHLHVAEERKRLHNFLCYDQRASLVNLIRKQYFFQAMRCKRFHFGSTDKFATLAYLCTVCTLRQKAFSWMPNQNKDSCCICGVYVAFKNENMLAYLCQFHKPLAAPGTSQCYVCKKVIFLNQERHGLTVSKLYLCSHCGTTKRCIHLEI